MDFMLQTHGSKYLCTIPDGLRELMMDITREVNQNHLFKNRITDIKSVRI